MTYVIQLVRVDEKAQDRRERAITAFAGIYGRGNNLNLFKRWAEQTLRHENVLFRFEFKGGANDIEDLMDPLTYAPPTHAKYMIPILEAELPKLRARVTNLSRKGNIEWASSINSYVRQMELYLSACQKHPEAKIKTFRQ